MGLNRKEIIVEKDPKNLLEFCCGINILKEDKDEAKLIDDDQCPDWLSSIDLSQKKIELKDLDPDSDAYWLRLKSMVSKRNAILALCRKRILNKPENMHRFELFKKTK
ncbi:MAG: Mitochondrial ribosomal protein L54 [Paramarteilia canceri]